MLTRIIFSCALLPSLSLLVGCDPDAHSSEGGLDGGEAPAYWAADQVIDAPGHDGDGAGDPHNAVNGVHGGGESSGNLEDVYSLGYEADVDNYIILGWSGRRVADGPGADFAVFENGFMIGEGPECFMDHVVVFVSPDGERWVPFPHDYVGEDESAYSAFPSDWRGFAGVSPVLFNEETNPVDPVDHALAGGDQFDLADLPDDDATAVDVKTSGFIHVKLVTAPSLVNPDTGSPYPRDQISNGADIDGVIAIYVE